MSGEHVREEIAVHEGFGVEARCPACREHWPCAAATPGILQLGEDLEAIHWQDGTTTLSIGRSALVELSQDEVQKLAEFLSKRPR